MGQDQQKRAASRNLSYKLAESLGRNLLSGRSQPGDILPGEVELGEMYGVSRTAVREAIKMLAAKGMVLPRPRIGTRVLPKRDWNYLDRDLLAWIDFETQPEIIKEFQQVRLTLEPEAAALTAVNASEQDRMELVELVGKMHELAVNYDQDSWVEVDTRFHQLVYFASGNHFISPFGNLFKAVFESYFRVAGREKLFKLEHHQAMVDAIVAKDGNAARQATVALLTA